MTIALESNVNVRKHRVASDRYCLVIVPTYNEAPNIARLIDAVLAEGRQFDVLVVDDGSPDGTGDIVAALAAQTQRVQLIRRAGKQGLGTAYLAGFRAGLQQGYHFLCEMDADFSHQPMYLPQLLACAEQEADVALGSRNVPGGRVENWSVVRQVISRGGSIYARAVLGMPIRDCTGGYKCFRAEVLRALDLDVVRSNGYAFQVEMNYRCHQAGFRLREIPIVFPDRIAGRSKMSHKIVLEAAWLVWRLRLNVPRRPLMTPPRRPAKSGSERVRLVTFTTRRQAARLWRPIRFGVVGLSGVIVNSGVLWLLARHTSLPIPVAAALAAEVAVISNFLLNDRWTFAASAARHSRLARLLRFNGVALGGMLISVGVLTAIMSVTQIPLLLANLIAIGVATAWNYVVNSRWTWRAAHAQPGLPPGIDPIVRRGISMSTLDSSFGRPGMSVGWGELPAPADEAVALAERLGVPTERVRAMMRQLEDEDAAYLARHGAAPRYDALQHPLDPEMARLLPEELARSLQALPVHATDGRVIVAMVNPRDRTARCEVSLRLERPVDPVEIDAYSFERALDQLYHEEYTYRSTRGLMAANPRQSAFRVVTQAQAAGLIALLVGSLAWLILNPIGFLIAFNAVSIIFLLAFAIHRFALVYYGITRGDAVPVSAEEIAALRDDDLPIYTILVPVYKEANVLPKLMRAIHSLDYPQAKLDIKLLLEANDDETIAAARSLNLPPNVDQVIVPDSLPKTKPKACNYGLIKARGELVVIYDAEDEPEPDQLKKVVVAFRKSTPDVVCMQARLNYYNRTQNLLTRWFTIEYSMWFDLFLPGLDATQSPIPLGGTSNHFRRAPLQQLGAWDPYNVTEDADLGVRLHANGYKTAIIDSTTYEEANSRVGNWIRQRSRWVKGYIQTWLVHMRHPLALWRTLGTRAFWSMNLTVGGTFLSFLLNPIYWTLTVLWFLTEAQLIEQIFPTIIFYLGAINLFIGNFTFMYLNVLGALRRQFYDLVKYAVISPFYWVLISIAAWKGFIQLFTKPFYWEKTIHGLYPGDHQQPEAPVPAEEPPLLERAAGESYETGPQETHQEAPHAARIG